MPYYIYGMNHYCLKDWQIIFSEDVCQALNKVELLINVMHHHMEDTLEETEQPKKFSNKAFISLPYSETMLNWLNNVIDDREWST